MIRVHLNKEEIQYILKNYNRLSSKEMADWIGCVPGTIVYQLKKHGLQPVSFSKWSPKKLEELIKLRRQGFSRRTLANHFGVTELSIQGQLKLLRKSGVDVPSHLAIKKNKKKCVILSSKEVV